MKKRILTTLMAISVLTLVAQEKFQPTNESFAKNYRCPDWFRDAKFGIWAHWGPQSFSQGGSDWYAKEMYVSDNFDKKTKSYTGKPHSDYILHLQKYGHPSVFGYKDLVNLWKA